MFSKIFQKTALLGASTVASVALTGTMMATAQAATMSYTSEFSITSNSLNGEIATGDFSFTKTELTGEDSGLFGYKLEGFNASVNASVGFFNFSESFTLSDVKSNATLFQAINQAFVPDKYQGILPSVSADKDFDYVGDGDFPPPDFTREFSGEEFSGMQDGLTEIDISPLQALSLLDLAFREGGELSLTTTLVPQSNASLASVPEPTSILGIGIVGVGLTATRCKRKNKRINQKTVA